MLVYLLALGVFIAGCDRLVSTRRVGLPQPAAVWLACLIPELVLPIVGDYRRILGTAAPSARPAT